MKTKEILKKYNIELVYDHAIYFADKKDTAYGILAEDTNYIIKNIEQLQKIHPKEKIEKDIEENISLLFKNL